MIVLLLTIVSSCVKVKLPESNLVAKVGNVLIFERDLELVESSLEGCFPQYEDKISKQSAFIFLLKGLIATEICYNWGCNINEKLNATEISKAKKDCQYPQILSSLFENNNNLLVKDYIIPRVGVKKLFLYVYSGNPKANIKTYNDSKKFLSILKRNSDIKKIARRKNVRLYDVSINKSNKKIIKWEPIGKTFPYGNPVSTYEKTKKYYGELLKKSQKGVIEKIFEQHSGFEIIYFQKNNKDTLDYILAFFPKQSWNEFFTKEANKINIFVYYPEYEGVINKIPMLQGINIIYQE